MTLKQPTSWVNFQPGTISGASIEDLGTARVTFTLTNAPTTGVSGAALPHEAATFNGSNQYCSASLSGFDTSPLPFTLACTCLFAASGSDYVPIQFGTSASTNWRGVRIQRVSDDRIAFYFEGGTAGTESVLHSTSTVGEAEWVCLVATWDGEDMHLYLRGSLGTTDSAQLARTLDPAYDATGAFEVGGRIPISGSAYMNGSVQDGRWYLGEAWTPQEVDEYAYQMLGTGTTSIRAVAVGDEVTYEGGTPVQLTVSDYDLSFFEDPMTLPSPFAYWDDGSTGSGAVSAEPGAARIVLDSGTTASSTAEALAFGETARLPAQDVEVSVRLLSASLVDGAASGDSVQVDIGFEDGTGEQGITWKHDAFFTILQGFNLAGGTITRRLARVAPSEISDNASITVRLAMFEGKFWAEVDGVPYWSGTPGSNNARFFVRVSNSSSGSRVRAAISGHVVRPVLKLGDDRVSDASQDSLSLISLTTPALTSRDGAQQLTLLGYDGGVAEENDGNLLVVQPNTARERPVSGLVSIPRGAGASGDRPYPDGKDAAGTLYENVSGFDINDQLFLMHMRGATLTETAVGAPVDEVGWAEGGGTFTKAQPGPFGFADGSVRFQSRGGIAVGTGDTLYPPSNKQWGTYWVYRPTGWPLVFKAHLSRSRDSVTFFLIGQANSTGTSWGGRYNYGTTSPVDPPADLTTPTPADEWVFVFWAWDDDGVDGRARLWTHFAGQEAGVLRLDQTFPGTTQDWPSVSSGFGRSPWLIAVEYDLGPAIPLDLYMAEVSVFDGAYPGDTVRQGIYNIQAGLVSAEPLAPLTRQKTLVYKPPQF